MASIDVNEWLDEYNDYMVLYRMFGDERYLTAAKDVISFLRSHVARIHTNVMLFNKLYSDSVQG